MLARAALLAYIVASSATSHFVAEAAAASTASGSQSDYDYYEATPTPNKRHPSRHLTQRSAHASRQASATSESIPSSRSRRPPPRPHSSTLADELQPSESRESLLRLPTGMTSGSSSASPDETDSALHSPASRLSSRQVSGGAAAGHQSAGKSPSHTSQAATHVKPDAQSGRESLLTNAGSDHSVASAQGHIPLSSHECWWEGTPEEEANPEVLTKDSHHTVCRYSNLLIWEEQVYYVAEHPHPHLPRVRTAYEGAMWTETLDIRIVSPDALSAAWPSAPTQTWEAVMFWYISHFGNYGHMFGEHAPNMHVLACNILGYCDFNNEKQKEDLHIIFTNTKDRDLVGVWPKQIDEMWACWSEHKPMVLHEPPVDQKGQLTLVKSAAAGIGPKCRSLFFCRPFFGAQPPDADDMEGWRKRAAACFGIPGNTTLNYMDPPLIAVMNRQPGKARGIHNGQEVADLLQQQFGGQGAIVQHIRFDEDMTIRQQAAVYNKMAVLIQVHGAALANSIFLPRDAIVIDVMQKGYYARISWSIRSVRGYQNLRLGYIPLAEQASHLLPPARETPEYQDLNAAERDQVDRAECPRPEYGHHCDQWWWYGSTVIIDGFQAEQAVWMAMHQIGRGTP